MNVTMHISFRYVKATVKRMKYQKLRIYKKVPEYIENFNHYREGIDCGYYEQLCEVKVREYGEEN